MAVPMLIAGLVASYHYVTVSKLAETLVLLLWVFASRCAAGLNKNKNVAWEMMTKLMYV